MEYKMSNSKKSLVLKKENKWTKKKIVAASILGAAILSFVVVIIIAAVFQLGPARPIKSEKADLKTVGQIGGFDVRYEELKYFASVRNQELEESLGRYETLDAAAKAEYAEKLENAVIEDIRDVYAVFSLCEELGIEVNSTEADEFVQEKVEEFIEGRFEGDKKQYKAWISEGYLTDSVLRELYRVSYLETAIIDHLRENKIGILYDGENISDFIDYVAESGEWIRTIHAFYPKKSDTLDTSSSYSGANDAADALAAASSSQERYSVMIAIIGKAPFVSGFSTTGNGFYFSAGQMGEEYEAAAFALDEYGVSGVVETDDGYYVIMRLPIEKEHVTSNRASLLANYHYGVLKSYTDAEKQKLTFNKTNLFDETDLCGLK